MILNTLSGSETLTLPFISLSVTLSILIPITGNDLFKVLIVLEIIDVVLPFPSFKS